MEQCRGECLFGKCPNKVCIKYKNAGNMQPVKSNEAMQIMTSGVLPPHRSTGSGIGLAVDIGTTTVAVYLYDRATSGVLAVESGLNAQVSLGVDVRSRIKLCGDTADGLPMLREAIRAQLNELIGKACAGAGYAVDCIAGGVITGNTTMLHLLAGFSPVSMGVLPFEPECYFGYETTMGELGLVPAQAACYLPPCISAFVGADIVTGLLAAGFAKDENNCLLMDIGTNGEVALGGKNGIVSSSTAAGPAFEGAQISCGMAGVRGAINRVYAAAGKLRYDTIGGEKPRGLCGSGLLDAIAVFCRAGALDETGRIDEECPLCEKSAEGEVALRVAEGILLTQKDIREFQTAKAAVAAGVLALMHEKGIAHHEIETIYLAGGFGNYMDVSSAREVGLIPKEIHVKSIGNSAASGAALLLLDDSFRAQAEKLKQISNHVELGGNPYFMEKYIDCMYFE